MPHHWHLGLPGLPWGLDKHPWGAQGIHHSSLIDTHYSYNATHALLLSWLSTVIPL